MARGADDMERGPLKIYPQGMPAEFSGAPRWHWTYLVKCALDPLLATLVFFWLLALYGEPVDGAELAVLVLMLFLLFPTELPFRVFNRRVALTVLGAWLRVALGVAALWCAIRLFELRSDMHLPATLLWLALTPLAMLLLHCLTPRVVPWLRSLYPPPRNVVVVGVNDVAVRIAESISKRGEGLHFAGYFDDRSAARLAGFGPCPVIGRLEDVSGYVQRNGISAIYISLPMATQPRVVSLLHALADTTASIHFLPNIFVADPIQAKVTMVAGLPVVSVCETPFDGPAGVIKRVFDLTLILAALPLLIPLVLVIAALVRATSPGPAFFRQRRYGLDGKPITVLKFRTMTTLEDGEHTYTQVTRGDSRVTPLGAFLRATSLDELPQVFNVLCGTMSLVGPRPHALAVNEQYRKLIPRYMVRHKVKPGITGWAQVNGCRGGDDLESMRRRTEYDLSYLRSWSLALDVLIVFKTVKILLAGDESAY
jgi:putative colanic acid biosynthesis UDP-glucose lipid carrier transferase